MSALSRALPTLLLFATTTTWSPAEARELHADPGELIPVELATVGVNTVTGTPVVVLREPESGDAVTVVIGAPEAHAILMALNGIEVPRPMTHDLISNILAATGMRLERVLIDALVDGTYHGALELRANGGEESIYVDARPSDSLAVAVREDVAIFMAPAVLEAAREDGAEGWTTEATETALGITVVELTDAIRETLGIGERAGVVVSRSAGAAARAGIPPGALIVSVNGATPGTPREFAELVGDDGIGEPVRIVYWADGEEHEVELTPQPSDPGRIRDDRPKLQV